MNDKVFFCGNQASFAMVFQIPSFGCMKEWYDIFVELNHLGFNVGTIFCAYGLCAIITHFSARQFATEVTEL
jgi:hypothetical protein